MYLALAPLPRFRRRDRAVIWGSVIAAWFMTLVLIATSSDYLVGHDGVLGDRRFDWWLTLLLFTASWQLMTAAMMLPSSMPMMAMYLRVARNHANPRLLFGVFMLGYFVVWTGFAAAALGMDAGVHWLDGRVPAVTENPSFLAGAILILAGTFQFSSLKEHCLDTCRDPLAFFLKGYAPGAGAAWTLGLRHGLFCLGCCWALMLVMFAAGVAVLWWMAALTAVMVYEKTGRHGPALTPLIGVVLLGLAALAFAHPPWLPAPFSE